MSSTVEVAAGIDVTSDDLAALARANRSFFALTCNDHAWTSMLQAAGEGGVSVAHLGDVLAELLKDLSDARDGARWLREFVLDRGATTIVAVAREAARKSDDPSFVEAASDVLGSYGDQLGSLVEMGHAGLMRAETRQYKLLLDQGLAGMRQVAGEGDLLKAVLCSASVLLSVGGIVAMAIPPHVHGGVIAGVGFTAFKTWGCKLEELEQAPPQGKHFKL